MSSLQKLQFEKIQTGEGFEFLANIKFLKGTELRERDKFKFYFRKPNLPVPTSRIISKNISNPVRPKDVKVSVSDKKSNVIKPNVTNINKSSNNIKFDKISCSKSSKHQHCRFSNCKKCHISHCQHKICK